jgi:hypothetical protein
MKVSSAIVPAVTVDVVDEPVTLAVSVVDAAALEK